MSRRRHSKRMTLMEMAKKGLWDERQDMMQNHQPGDWNNYKLLSQYEYDRQQAWINNSQASAIFGHVSAKEFFDDYDKKHAKEYEANEQAISEADTYAARQNAKKRTGIADKKQDKNDDGSSAQKEEVKSNEKPANKEVTKSKQKNEQKSAVKSDEKVDTKPTKRPAPKKIVPDKDVVEKQNKEKAEKNKQADNAIARARKKMQKEQEQKAKEEQAEKQPDTDSTAKHDIKIVDAPKDYERKKPDVKDPDALRATEDVYQVGKEVELKQIRGIPDFILDYIDAYLAENKIVLVKGSKPISQAKRLSYFIAMQMNDADWHRYESYFSIDAKKVINKVRIRHKTSSVDKYAEESHKTNKQLKKLTELMQMSLLLAGEDFENGLMGKASYYTAFSSPADWVSFPFGRDGTVDMMLDRLQEVVHDKNSEENRRDFATNNFPHSKPSTSD